jgi:hypothetical protein
MLDKAKTRRAKPTASDAILIDCERPEDVPRRVDVLIAAGKVTEDERPRCVFWPNPDLDHWNGSPDEWTLMQDKNMTPEDLQSLWRAWVSTHDKNATLEEVQDLWDGAVAHARAAVLAGANPGDGSSKKRKSRFPVNRL